MLVRKRRKSLMSDIQKFREEYMVKARARERGYSQKATEAIFSPAKEKPFGEGDVRIPRFNGGGPNAIDVGTSQISKAPMNFLAEEALTPANYIPVAGLSMMRKGDQMTREVVPNLNRGQENAGLFLTSPRNLIENFYGPTHIPADAVPNRLDNYIARDPQGFAEKVRRIPKVGPMVANTVKDAKNAEQIMQGRIRAQDFFKWGKEGTKQGLFNLMNPDARALYYSTGVNPTTVRVAQEAVESDVGRDLSTAIAQGQQNIVTNTRRGREGPIDPTLDTVDRISYMSDTVPFERGAYSSLVKDVAARNNTPQKDLDFFEEHIGNVWQVGKGEKAEKFADAASPKINIKTPTTYQTGNHAFDFAHKGPMRTFATLFKEKSTVSDAELLAKFKSSDKLKLHPKMGQTDEEILSNAKKNGGFYFTGSMVGTAITEGGVNYVGKITPRGRVTAVMSDENNFLENVPVVGKAVEKALPNRMVNATPPMIFDASSDNAIALARSVNVPAKEEMTQSYRELIEAVAGIKADPKVLAGERLRTAGMLTTGAGVGAMGQKED
jgi:hypothetical protein